MRNIFLALLLFTAFSNALSAQQNYYSVKFPDDRTIVSCGGTADTSDWPVINYLGNCSFNVGVSVKDQVFYLNNTGTCKKIIRTWKLLWWCDFNPNWAGPTIILNPSNTDVGPTVIGNSINHGYLQYAQVIKVIDNVPPVFLNCPTAPVLFCDYTNNDPAQYGGRCEGPVDLNVKVTDLCSKSDLVLSYRLYLDLDGNGSMETYRSSSASDAWPIEKTIVNDTVSAKIKLPAGVGLPYGKHKVEWIANDRCGNEALCKYEFEVKDCKPPTVVCMNGLSINIMQTGMITLWDTDFLQYTSDNCTPTSQIKIAIRKAGTGTGFPADQHSVTFDCNEVGKQFVEIWAQDAYGNADYCTTFVIVQDHIGACMPSGPVSGNISTDQQQSVAGAKVLLKSNLQAIQQQSTSVSDVNGAYLFAAAPGTCNYSIVPTLDTLPAQGVNTLDVMLAEMHINGQSPLGNPYRIIAADVNKDGLVNQADLDAMNSLIVGTSTKFPNNTAWRFVPSAFVFPNPAQPLAAAFPEKISTVCPVPNGQQHHFTAIKTGDLNGSVFQSNRPGDPVAFSAENKRFAAGERVELTIYTPDLATLSGFQFGLQADPAYLQLQDVVAGDISPKFGWNTQDNSVSLSWYDLGGKEGIVPAITLHFQAVQSGFMADALQLNSATTRAEAYDKDLATGIVNLSFNAAPRAEAPARATAAAQLFAVEPNPSANPFTARFSLPAEGFVVLTLVDVNGKMVLRQEGRFGKGVHAQALNAPGSGVYFLQLQTASGNVVQKVIVE